jgi:hypothetical protein
VSLSDRGAVSSRKPDFSQFAGAHWRLRGRQSGLLDFLDTWVAGGLGLGGLGFRVGLGGLGLGLPQAQQSP